jgi:hypothetical protein
MGIQLWGAFGGFQKKTGALVGRWLNGQNVITAIPHPSKKPPTSAQLNQRAKFGMLVSFLRPISPLIKVGFMGAHAEKQSAWNAAYVYNYRRVITGLGPAFTIDYTKVVYSIGFLSPAYDPGAMTSGAEPYTVVFDWKAFFSPGSGADTDLVTVMVYNPDMDRYVYLANAAPRSALTINLTVPINYMGYQVHCYISFVSADGKSSSNSTYLGTVTVI